MAKMLNWRNIMRTAAKLAVGRAQAGEPHEVVESVLFAPGAGQSPLHIAGRDDEMQTLGRMLSRLGRKQSPSHNAALHAPRGMGKSVLLDKIAKEAKAAGVRAEFLSASEIRTLESLYKRTLGQPVPRSQQSEKGVEAQVGGKRAKIGGTLKQMTQQGGMDSGDWRNALEIQCRQHPLLLLIDEAHTMDLNVAHILLNASQNLRRNAPFALVIAGTPGLESHISKAETTFWERLASGDMRLSLLSQNEAQDALRRPLQDKALGLPFNEDAIAEMAKRSDGYPYFVQLWGEQAELHSRRHGGARITLEAVHAIEPAVTRMRDDLYRKRWDEICRENIREAVERVAPILAETNAIISNDYAKELMGSQQRLDAAVRLGVLQEGKDAGTVQAGIPSLMRYFMESQARLERLATQEHTSLDGANNHAHPKPRDDD